MRTLIYALGIRMEKGGRRFEKFLVEEDEKLREWIMK